MFLSYFDFGKAKHLISQNKMNNEEFRIAYRNFEHACVEMDAPSPREMKEVTNAFRIKLLYGFCEGQTRTHITTGTF